jgi:multidrug transporter EmrE-like cation transporter
LTEWLQLGLAAISYSLGGLYMKLSEGATRPWATAAFLALFAFGALLQAFAMKRMPLGPAYMAVLGLEATFTFVLSAVYLRESYSPGKVLAVLLILGGVVLLRR